jgi:hypothetical protein
MEGEEERRFFHAGNIHAVVSRVLPFWPPNFEVAEYEKR